MTFALALSALLGHHDSAVGRIDAPTELAVDSDLTGAKVEASSGYVFSRFDPVSPSDGTFTGDTAPLDVHTLLLTSRLFTEEGWILAAAASAGISGDQAGVGDATLSAGRWFSLRSLDVLSELGFVLPTGRYEPEAVRSAAEFATTDSGGLDLRTSDTRTSLGADTFAAQWRTRAIWDLGRLKPALGLQVRQPLTETEDGILWGTDVLASTSLFTRIDRDFGVSTELAYNRHWADRLDVENDEDGEIRRARLGGRHIVSAGVGLHFSWSKRAGCGAGARLPLVRQTETIQWVESYALNVQCSAAFNL